MLNIPYSHYYWVGGPPKLPKLPQSRAAAAHVGVSGLGFSQVSQEMPISGQTMSNELEARRVQPVKTNLRERVYLASEQRISWSK